MLSKDQLDQATGLDVYESSIVEKDGSTFFLAGKGRQKLVGIVGPGCWQGTEEVAQIDGLCVCVGPADHNAAEHIRRLLPWTAAKCVGLATSAGLGDRLGLATPGHIRSIRDSGVVPILAQQSIREMTRTQRTPEQVMDAATFGVLQEGYTDGFGSDADHLQQLEDIDVTVAAGFTMFTIDPGQHVVNEADELSSDQLESRFDTLTDLVAQLDTSPADLKGSYVGKTFDLVGGGSVAFDAETFYRAFIKYGGAVAHTLKMYRHLQTRLDDEKFELEVSVDETDSPTSPAEHYFFANELKRCGVKWVSMAPRFIGRFEKGVDYIGDLDIFRKSFAEHVAVMRTLGPYKMSIHSGSDKFSIYPIVAEMTGGTVHLKTAGTSYLEALRAISKVQPDLYREILDFARDRYETDKATYHVSADVSKVPAADTLSDDQLADLLDDFDARQVFHVTFGSVLTAEGGSKFRTRMYEALETHEQEHYDVLAHHLGRHVEPFAQVAK